MYVKKEAVLSSQIEGTQASLIDILGDDIDNSSINRDIGDVVNYVNAMNYGLSRLTSLPMSLRLIREIHAILLENSRGASKNPGEFRTSQNRIGPAGCTLDQALFIPPPPYEMMKAMGNGRIGRLIIAFWLCQQNILAEPLLYLSYYFKQNRLEYYDRLMAVRLKDDWEGWTKFFLRGIAEVSDQAISTAKEILDIERIIWHC
jgi:Fic family protein